MAASAGPRPGWSRRAQYGLFFSFMAVVAGLIIGLALLILSLAAPQSFAVVRGAALDLTAPISVSLRQVTTTVSGLVGGAGNYWDAANQNGRLKRDRAALMRRMVEARAILEENRQLKAALQLRERSGKTVATGRVVGSSFESPRRFAVISVGTDEGVANGMPVRAPEGLIGRVVDSGRTASRVLLVTDRANIVPARILRGGQPVISTGRGDGTIDVRPLEVGKNPFRPGDIIVTSGTGGLYPPLVPIAKVVRLDDDGAIALPIADPSRVSFAIVEPPFEPAALAAAAASGDVEP
ncbi:MAG: rod shape-determining protein MreC [Sphingomonas sp.]|uniref:rod shape-determining protein MreC n=1 Tax=Sphingomonas sp. TaxID=28214 RepID=UPI0017AD5F4D|nr:rod shape-determining protein MreC [Sphingomonas sp.]MBA3666292.1 rod shape-determining protein MreC [Sphingomonas sp.]